MVFSVHIWKNCLILPVIIEILGIELRVQPNLLVWDDYKQINLVKYDDKHILLTCLKQLIKTKSQLHSEGIGVGGRWYRHRC